MCNERETQEEAVALDVNSALDEMEFSAQEYADARNLYRNEKAKLVLLILNPPKEQRPVDWKKPTEKQLDAMIDSNPKLQLLRADRDQKQVKAEACRLAAEAVVKGI